MNKKLIIGTAAGILLLAAIIFAIIFISTAPAGGSVQERETAAQALTDRGKLTKAANTYKSILKDDSANRDAAIKLSDVYVQKGDFDNAADSLKQAITHAPDDTELYDKLMGVYFKSRDSISALSFIEDIDDTELRRKYLNAAYDRTSATPLAIGNTMGNLSSGGVLAFADDTVFYCDIAKGNSLFALRDGKSTLLCDGNVSALNIVGDWLYFVDKARDYSIFKMKLDGSEHTRVADVMATNLIVIGDKMYFINWNEECRVYSMDTNGKNLTQLSDISTEMLYCYGTNLYINDRNDEANFYRLSLDGKSKTLMGYESVYFVSGYDNNLYFRQGNDELNIWRMTADGSVYEPLNNSRSGYINVSDGYVFFVDFADNGSIIRMNEDGSGAVKLCSDGANNLSSDGEYLYYFSDYNDKKLYRIKKDGTEKECLN
ncbi:MAG: DUF5050 domain-containing protein [Oscillospiraceae bacterium]|nr:DUF5050 domain-containing protein [Oscillospiraceae bacterium]